ncbi:glucarate dehydratase family protein [Wenjunlia tyrosinilytica]|uniref:glucarate dehydratase n=1 Tax=Wenjunlia tyrosinilytica TaxID=1544741 RepID=A0A917ZDM4_9ACTN|nr:glucarate dehydratase family protein [Wenjunlia tyrosinilytica]GGO81498.1 glucarate dehydratase [Wenjunlia tyrosinilytica]
MTALRITGIRVTPVAVQDPPLLNSVGVHEPFALRSIVEVDTDSGITGIGEAYGDAPTLERLTAVAPALTGLDVFDLNELNRRVTEALGCAVRPDALTPLIGSGSRAKAVAATAAAFEVPCLDAQGKAIGRPVVDLLGGRARDRVPYSAYLFHRWAKHPIDPGYPEDDWGEALGPEGIVEQARRMVARYGFTSLKLKGGVLPPDQETDAILALRDAFPGHPLRIDPNANWTVPTALKVAERLTGTLEYLEDPVGGIAGMSEVARSTDIPLATNMCVTSMEELPEAVERQAVKIVLSDHHFWGGLRATQHLAAVCGTFGLGLSMHSNTHLGISLAAMTHLAAAVPGLTYACDTHSPWQREEVVEPGVLEISGGAVTVPRGPGLGVSIDRDALGRLHEQYLRCEIRRRDDIAAMRVVDPDWTGGRPRW